VCVALGIQRAMRMRRIVICELPRCTKYFHIMSYKSLFSGGGGGWGVGGYETKCAIRVLLQHISQHFSFQKELGGMIIKICIGLHVK